MSEIWAFVAAETSREAGTRLVKKIMAACDAPQQFPASGAARDYLAPGLRVVFSGAYAINYLHVEQDIVVIRVLHGARDIEALAGRGGFGGRP